MSKNRQVILTSNPKGQFSPENFQLRDAPIPSPGDGQFLLRNLYLSLDPAMRIWAAPVDGYAPPVRPGDLMRGFTVSQVLESNHPGFKVGDIVNGMDGWRASWCSIITLICAAKWKPNLLAGLRQAN
jgi:NADPH-dependent curcumin reductase CurA